jgi:tRNA (guanine37-N1)-methyltransferase
VLGHEQGAEDETFAGGLLEFPQYTRPRDFRGMRVPEVLLSGNHAAIAAWRMEQRKLRTKERRPDLWRKYCESNEGRATRAEEETQKKESEHEAP